MRTKLINYMSVLCPSPFSDNITNIGLEIRINVYCKHITFEVLYPENNQLMVGSVQSENLTMHLVSMLVRGRAVAAVFSSCTAECGTLTWTVGSRYTESRSIRYTENTLDTVESIVETRH